MKKNLIFHNAKNALRLSLVATLAIFLSNCSTEDNALSGGDGTGSLQFTLAGITDSPEEILTRSEATPQTAYVPLDNGLLMSCTLSPDLTPKTRAASPMTGGNTYRLVVLSGSTIVGSADGVAGGTVPLVNNLAPGTYTVVAYSFNSTTLPTAGASIAVPAGTDLLYFSQSGVTVTAGNQTPVTVTFSRKSTAVKVVADARGLVGNTNEAATVGIGKIVTAASATFSKSYDATMAVSSGALTAGTAYTPSLAFPTLNTLNPTSNQILLYGGGDASFTITFPSITFGASGDIYTQTATNASVSFGTTLAPGTRYTVTVTFHKKCGAYIATPGTAGSWKEFLCWNLTGTGTYDSSANPFTPSYKINGAYWQWGNLAPSASAPDAAGSDGGAISGWGTTPLIGNPINSAWNSGTETAPVKNTTYDPCPAGYRVPTMAEWNAVMANNTSGYTPATWTTGNNVFSDARTFGPSASAVTLLLPIAGFHIYNTGTLGARGAQGYYWSSFTSTSYRRSLEIASTTNTISYNFSQGNDAFSVRCIAE